MNASPITSQISTSPAQRGACGWLLAVVLLGTILRCWQATESLWLDELHTSWVVVDGPGDIAWRARAGNQSPLWFYLVWGVTQLFGHHEWSLRLTSLVSGILLIPASFELVRRWTASASAGLLVAVLVAVNGDCIFFAQEARPYALVQLSAVVHAAIFLSVLQRPVRWRRGLLVAGAAWLFYLHYTSFLFLISQAVCLAILYVRKRPTIAYSWPQASCDAALTVLWYTPALTHVLAVAGHRDNWARIIAAWPPPTSLQLAVIVYALVPLAALRLSGRGSCRRARSGLGSTPSIWSACWFLVPPLLAFGCTISGLAALCMVRYLVASIVGALVFAAICQSGCQTRWCRWCLNCVLVVATVAASGMIPQWSRDGRLIGERNEAWDAAVPWLQSAIQREPLPVFLCANLLEDLALRTHADPHLQQYCLFPFSGIYRLQTPELTSLPTSPHVAWTPRQSRDIALRGGAWLVVRAGPSATREITAALLQSLRRYGYSPCVVLTKRFGDLAIVQVKCSVTPATVSPPSRTDPDLLVRRSTRTSPGSAPVRAT